MITIKETDLPTSVYLELEDLALHEMEQLKSMLFGLAHATITSDAATYDPERLTSAIFLAQDFVEAIQEKIQKLSGLALKDNKQHSEMIKHLTEELSRSSCCGKS